MIAEGRVTVNGAVADKAARQVQPGDAIECRGARDRFVGRGGYKMLAAIEGFGLEVEDLRCIDAGASTGGFSDCLLQHGAAHVVAIDVGRGQLHERLRASDRVTVLERTDIRAVEPEAIGGPASLVVADLSFIAIRSVSTALLGLCAPDGQLVILVKPQFELGRAVVSKGRGVVRDPDQHAEAIRAARDHLSQAGAQIVGLIRSPITGAAGNVEFLALVRPTTRRDGDDDVSVSDADIERIVRPAGSLP